MRKQFLSYEALIQKDVRKVLRKKMLLVYLISFFAAFFVTFNFLAFSSFASNLESLNLILQYFGMFLPIVGISIVLSLSFNLIIDEIQSKTLFYLFSGPLENKHLFIGKTLSSAALPLILYLILCVGYLINFNIISYIKNIGYYLFNLSYFTYLFIITPLVMLTTTMFIILLSLKVKDVRIVRKYGGLPGLLIFPAFLSSYINSLYNQGVRVNIIKLKSLPITFLITLITALIIFYLGEKSFDYEKIIKE